MEIVSVHPNNVTFRRETHQREVDYQKSRLQTEGQIEPIVVRKTKTGYAVNEYHDEAFCYSSEIVKAAQELKWPTILVTY